ncbi:hypothetical protein EV122DRAFT_192372, partial [Schizophyllum commune]
MQTGYRLRQLFATMLLFCGPAQPERLWDEYKDFICDDLGYRLRCAGMSNPSLDDIYDYGLY